MFLLQIPSWCPFFEAQRGYINHSSFIERTSFSLKLKQDDISSDSSCSCCSGSQHWQVTLTFYFNKINPYDISPYNCFRQVTADLTLSLVPESKKPCNEDWMTYCLNDIALLTCDKMAKFSIKDLRKANTIQFPEGPIFTKQESPEAIDGYHAFYYTHGDCEADLIVPEKGTRCNSME